MQYSNRILALKLKDKFMLHKLHCNSSLYSICWQWSW